eukprot:COSAG02_NODE_1504_length_12250_cov_12.501934_4_plen_132_part_00
MNVVEQRRAGKSLYMCGMDRTGRCVFWLQSPVAVPVRFGSTHTVSIQAPEFLHVNTYGTVLYRTVGRSRSEARVCRVCAVRMRTQCRSVRPWLRVGAGAGAGREGLLRTEGGGQGSLPPPMHRVEEEKNHE